MFVYFRLLSIAPTVHMAGPVILAAEVNETQSDRSVIRFG